MRWPTSPEDLVDLQVQLAARTPEPWAPAGGPVLVGACFVCFDQDAGAGRAGDPAWAAAALTLNRRFQGAAVVAGRAGTEYQSGLMALREGPLLEAAVRELATPPDVLLVNATGRDHPRRAGLALHLGVMLDLPSIGVTHRTLLATGEHPGAERGMAAPLKVDDTTVGSWLRTRPGTRPVAVHAAWRTDSDVAARVVLQTIRRARTPEPMRRARRIARLARAGEMGVGRVIR